VHPLVRLRKRNNPEPTDVSSGRSSAKLLNAVLDELDLKADRRATPGTAYSLRHTYISMRLMEGADIYQIAKNCRTSVEMIEKFYASHNANTLTQPRSTCGSNLSAEDRFRGQGPAEA